MSTTTEPTIPVSTTAEPTTATTAEPTIPKPTAASTTVLPVPDNSSGVVVIGAAVGAAGAVAALASLGWYLLAAARKEEDDVEDVEVEVDQVSDFREVQMNVGQDDFF
ncbi:MAG: hypothetical protein KVP17_001145 [Porospora cf. gigantea B]|uniref:uncharacterized protein n=1 Tax=Porospora cf. gigantea B TaxID=2853592 RepID=UPI003571BD71|nr:MAG: hypothetical protein KVP17_001145 [Porospora cf. gigantea B]